MWNSPWMSQSWASTTVRCNLLFPSRCLSVDAGCASRLVVRDECPVGFSVLPSHLLQASNNLRAYSTWDDVLVVNMCIYAQFEKRVRNLQHEDMRMSVIMDYQYPFDRPTHTKIFIIVLESLKSRRDRWVFLRLWLFRATHICFNGYCKTVK